MRPLSSRATSIKTLRRQAIAHTLFGPTTLGRAVTRLGFVQADPIRAPARAQDLILMQRVRGYRAGDLERRYSALKVHEDAFINYGFVSHALHALMHPRSAARAFSALEQRRVAPLLAFIADRGQVHPREVDAAFAHGRVSNAWGGASNATTALLDRLHYLGALRVVKRQAGIRIYGLHPDRSTTGAVLRLGACERQDRLDALVDAVVALYAPLPARSLAEVVRRLRFGVPQWRAHLEGALLRARARLWRVQADGVDWYWPQRHGNARGHANANANDLVDAAFDAESDAAAGCAAGVDALGARLLAPFDPLVWDRRRFELFWGWPYRFEAYTPAAKRTLGYYALPLLWRDAVVGWGELALDDLTLQARIGLRTVRRSRALVRAVEEEVERHALFLRATHTSLSWST